MSDRFELAEIAARLQATRPPEDATRVVLPAVSASWPGDVRQRMQSDLKASAVLVPLLEREHGLNVLLTRRSRALKHHAGQISFPGGRMDASDADITATALRETHEEVGIKASDVRVLGYLAPLPTVSGYAVTPVIAAVDASAGLTVDPGEVDLAFEVPFDFLMDRHNVQEAIRQYQGADIQTWEYRYESHRIWGATANILQELRNKLL